MIMKRLPLRLRKGSICKRGLLIMTSAFLEPMSMPDPTFPVKVNYCKSHEYGATLFPNHWHKHIELLYVVYGQAIFECNGVPIPVGPGSLVYVNGNDLHTGICTSDDLFYYALIFDPAVLQSSSVDAIETKYMLPLLHNGVVFPNQVDQAEPLTARFLSIVKELKEREPGYEMAVKSDLYRMLTEMLRSSTGQMMTVKNRQNRMRQLERLTPVLSYIEEHYHEELSVELLSEQAGLSRFHFSRLFKQLTDKSVTAYVNDIRIRQADYLLRNTQQTVSDIALAVGYRDIYYFSRMYKKCRGIPPSEVRD